MRGCVSLLKNRIENRSRKIKWEFCLLYICAREIILTFFCLSNPIVRTKLKTGENRRKQAKIKENTKNKRMSRKEFLLQKLENFLQWWDNFSANYQSLVEKNKGNFDTLPVEN